MASAAKRVLKDGSLVYRAKWRGWDGAWHEEGKFTTKSAAEKAALRREMDSERGMGVAARDGKITFLDFVDSRYWPSTQTLSPNTRAAYRSNLDAHFLPTFGKMPLAKITTGVVQKWVNEAAQDGLASRSIFKYHVLLSSIFKMAAEDGRIPVNPCLRTRLPRVVRREKRAMSVEEFEALLAAMPEEHQTFVTLMMETGCRWGEVIALRACDVDWDTDEIVVSRAYAEVSKKISPTGERMVLRDGPKEGEWRRVQVSTSVITLLREHMVSTGVRHEDLLFSTERGTPISRNTFRTRVWQPARIKAKLPLDVTPHLLRHSHISWLLAGGADLVVTMRRVGHRQISTTQGYLHSMPDAGKRALAAIENFKQSQAEPDADRPTPRSQTS